jgi:hypothetical protein
MPLEAEAVEQRSCITRRSPIIDRISCTQQKRISARRPDRAELFNAICAFRPAGIDVKLPFEIVALNASTGRIADLKPLGENGRFPPISDLPLTANRA